jgi:uncharacterized protein GlcG (DUF336 family)
MKIGRSKQAIVSFVSTLAISLALHGQQAPLETKPVLTLEAARGMVTAAEKEAAKNHWAMVIAIVDDGGNLLILERMNNAHLASIEIAQKKARTSAIFNAPSKVFGDGVAGGTHALLALDVLPFAGGLPIMAKGKQIGSIGVSGGDQDSMDNKVAQAAVDWLEANLRK